MNLLRSTFPQILRIFAHVHVKKTHKHTNLDHNLVTRWGDKDVSHVVVQVRYVHVQDISMSHRPNSSRRSKLWAFKLEFEKNLNLQTLIDTQVR